jgi:hypothetical protein
MQIDVDLLKQFRESADWIMQLPEKMVKAIMNTKVALLNRRERVAKYKELAELREIGKSIQQLYAFKGNILLYANIMQRERNFEDIKEIRRLFASAVELLDDIWAAISHAYPVDAQTYYILWCFRRVSRSRRSSRARSRPRSIAAS